MSTQKLSETAAVKLNSGNIMQIKRVLDKANRFASILLLVCFFLPLSQCTPKVNIDGGRDERISHLYASNIAKDGFHDLKGNEMSGSYPLLAILIIFFLPFLLLFCKVSVRSVFNILAAPLAGNVLFCWVYLFSTKPEVGGVIASVCWVIIFFSNVFTIIGFVRDKADNRSGERHTAIYNGRFRR